MTACIARAVERLAHDLMGGELGPAGVVAAGGEHEQRDVRQVAAVARARAEASTIPSVIEGQAHDNP